MINRLSMMSGGIENGGGYLNTVFFFICFSPSNDQVFLSTIILNDFLFVFHGSFYKTKNKTHRIKEKPYLVSARRGDKKNGVFIAPFCSDFLKFPYHFSLSHVQYNVFLFCLKSQLLLAMSNS